MPTRALNSILWLQLLLGCIAAALSWGPMFAGAMGTEWVSGIKQDLVTMQRSADYREPPRIGGLAYSDILDRLQASTFDHMHLAGYCFLAALGLIFVSVVELWLVHRLRRYLVAPNMKPTPRE